MFPPHRICILIFLVYLIYISSTEQMHVLTMSDILDQVKVTLTELLLITLAGGELSVVYTRFTNV